MYQKYAEARGWPLEILSQNHGDHGGFREIIIRVAGQGAYSRFKFESGTHRVQRVPETESQGRIHTSACTVAILPEVEALKKLTSTRQICGWTHSVPPAQADSTSTKRIPQSG